MSALFDRISARLTQGHARTDVPLHRDPRALMSEDFKPAAVLVALTEREEPGVLLLHRPSTMRAHPGQVALPGGRIDADETPIDAALREAHEELGIAPALVRVIGQTDRYATGSGYDITPVIGVIPPDLAISPNPTEVAQWFEAPLAFVLDPANHHLKTSEWEGRKVDYFEIQWREHRIWGVTAGVLRNLSLRLGCHV
ncbi:CoA pyrophosphatase [Novosphingobium colocasiae]|uniref:CoA pyrophosphatase n=1 Tax=Novosphingobium colocasiae TaxID=1256513 RepID=UPI0035B3C5FF